MQPDLPPSYLDRPYIIGEGRHNHAPSSHRTYIMSGEDADPFSDIDWPSEDEDQWTEEVRLEVEAGRRVATQIESDATLITAQLRDAWAAVDAFPATQLNDGDTAVVDALDAFASIAKDLNLALGRCQYGKGHKMGLDTWARMYDAGLPDMVQDIVMQEKFWMLPRLITIGNVFDTQMRIAYASFHSYRTFCSRVLSRSDALWTAMWKNRHLITDWPRDGTFSDTQEHPVVQTLVIYYVLYRHTEERVSLSSHMPHFSLYAWATAEFQTGNFGTVYRCKDGLNGPSYRPEDFIRQAILDGVGIDVCFTRLAQVLRGEDPGHWASVAELEGCMEVFSGLLYGGNTQNPDPHPDVTVLIIGAGQHRIPHLTIAIAKKHALAGGLRANPRFYRSTFSLLLRSLMYDCFTTRSATPSQWLLVSGEDVVTLLACAIDLLAVHGNEVGMKDDAHVYAAFEVIKATLSSFMQIYYDRAKKIQDKAPGTALALEVELLSGMQCGAKEHWWASLRALTATKRRCEGRNEDIVKFGTLWKGFGALLGCDAKRERERDALVAAGRCSWLECEYHRKAAEKQLLRCKGCGVYYCSRDCQVVDWKKGHKKECKRLKAGDTD